MVLRNAGEAPSREAAVMRSLAREIGQLQGLGLSQLRARYQEAFGYEARSKNLQFLRKKIAFRLQEQIEMGLSDVAQKRIQELVPLEMQAMPLPRTKTPVRTAPFPSARSEGRDPRLPNPGTLISREFKGFLHEVQVLEAGFRYRGRPYRSLSAIAKEITGTPWNGFLFFGLTKPGDRNGR